MNINFLRRLDRWLGPLLLSIIGPLGWLISALLPGQHAGPATAQRLVFLKLKGGGSLIIALPALLAMRRAAANAEFILVCTPETKVYAELTGVFDRYCLIEDKSALSLSMSALKALATSFRADICVDLEPNSILAAVFNVLTLAKRRFGFVKLEERYRRVAYTDAVSFNVFAPIYVYYDQLAELFGAEPVTLSECREQLRRVIPTKTKEGTLKTIGLAPFTSDFARERMMPDGIWSGLLKNYLGSAPARLLVIGSANNEAMGKSFTATLQKDFPGFEINNLCGNMSLSEAAAIMASVDEIWAVDSGLLHIARLLAPKCRSYWGPSSPAQRLRPIGGLEEETIYRQFACSPCVHAAGPPPCEGNNLCMKTMLDPSPNLAPVWCVGGAL
ncbi:MAG: glycosyltransferase family 9 protein [Alphaproteobacteria bacterium]